MPLAAGTRLGPYEIVAPAGAGGMGEVYRARDTRLDRTVAVKVLPPWLAEDPQVRDRFEREARAISSLQHPHICALFDVGEADAIRFLVLEFLEGETLADRLGRAGALPVADAMRIGIEICDALHKAHRSGIVHRDLKPANVFLVRKGGPSSSPTAKLLDFGLAKTAAPAVATSGLSMVPTTPPNVTAQGTILGTFQYMAPEQIEGLEADARTDIFAFGALLFEMVTGRTAFEGRTRAALLGSILKDDPTPVTQLQPSAPPALDRIVATCLAKDPDDRYQSARDLLRDLQVAATDRPGADAGAVSVAAPRFGGRRTWALAIALALISGLGAFFAARFTSRPSERETVQFPIPPPAGATFATPGGGGTGFAPQVTVSPDGRLVVFVALGPGGNQLWVRPMGTLEARALPGTEGGAFPFWSPDSRHLGFFARGRLLRVPVAGGPPVALCDAPSGRGGTWNRDNVIVFTPATGGTLQRVAAAGGSPTPVSTLDTEYGETNHRFPQFLPDGRHLLYVATVGTCCPAIKPARIKVGALDTADVSVILEVESAGVYASGHLLFNRDGTLMAQPFDSAAIQLAGDAFPVVDGVASEGSRYVSVSASDAGVLAYARGLSRPRSRLTWMDRSGRIVNTIGDAATYSGLSLSPDEKRVAAVYGSGIPENRDVYLLDMARGTPARFTFEPGTDNFPIWSHDGTRIVFQANRDGAATLRMKRVDDASAEEALTTFSAGVGAPNPSSWSQDGQHILFTRAGDIWVLALNSGEAKRITETPAGENVPVFAPNGRWFAYESSESGQLQIYVQPFPPTGRKEMVSQNGGAQPEWRRDGREMYFLSPDQRLMAVPVDTTGSFSSGAPAVLFPTSTITISGAASRQYAASKDGQRFLVSLLQPEAAASPLTVVVNWLASVQK